jgi:hypothetical protein
MLPKVNHKGVSVNSYRYLGSSLVWGKSGIVAVVVDHADEMSAMHTTIQTYCLRFTKKLSNDLDNFNLGQTW